MCVRSNTLIPADKLRHVPDTELVITFESGAWLRVLCCLPAAQYLELLSWCLQDYVAAEGEGDRIPEALQAAMALVILAEQSEQQGAAGQVNPQLRKHTYPEAESAFRKRNRRDIRPQAANNGAS